MVASAFVYLIVDVSKGTFVLNCDIFNRLKVTWRDPLPSLQDPSVRRSGMSPSCGCSRTPCVPWKHNERRTPSFSGNRILVRVSLEGLVGWGSGQGQIQGFDGGTSGFR